MNQNNNQESTKEETPGSAPSNKQIKVLLEFHKKLNNSYLTNDQE